MSDATYAGALPPRRPQRANLGPRAAAVQHLCRRGHRGRSALLRGEAEGGLAPVSCVKRLHSHTPPRSVECGARIV